MTRQAALRLLAAGLALATIAAYSQLRHSSFIAYDTPDYVLEREPVLRGLTADGVRWAFTNTAQANWQPLTWLSHMADVELFGVDAVAHKPWACTCWPAWRCCSCFSR